MTSFIIKPYTLIYIFLSISLCIFAQDNIKPFQYSSTNKKALKYFDEGKRYYDARKDKQAEEYFLKASLRKRESFLKNCKMKNFVIK